MFVNRRSRSIKAGIHIYSVEDMSTKPSTPNQFLNGTNYQKILGFFRQQYTNKLGSNISERMDSRLQKTIQHYMVEINRVQSGKPVPSMNQEVLRETTASMDSWLKKQEAPTNQVVSSVGSFSKPDEYSRLFEDTSTRYESMMMERTPPVAKIPSTPDFRVMNDMDDEEDPVVLMQRIQKQREETTRSIAKNQAPRMDIKEEQPSATNPVPPQAERPPSLLAPRPQDYIIPQEDIVKYRETEYNIFLTSSDRDWLRNTSESRYNFTVNFNTGSKRTGFPFNASLQERFRNIQRIEFVKAILPIESLTTLPRIAAVDAISGVGTYDTTRVINVFSLPFLGVRIAELNNNGFSTKPEEDNTFALVQYDTTWGSDLVAPATSSTSNTSVLPLTKSGYVGVIPKFLKTQKVYTPTPLATLQKLSIRIERHSGDLLSNESDVLVPSSVFLSSSTSGSNYSVTSPNNSYIFIQTRDYFPFSAVAEGDLIQFQGYELTTPSTPTTSDFTTFINRPSGHYVVATAYTTSTTAPFTINDTRNNAGYCNIIILRSRFQDPSSGAVLRDYFGGSSDDNDLASILVTDVPKGGALLNTSRQTHIVLRVITRDMDSSSNIRPDNV